MRTSLTVFQAKSRGFQAVMILPIARRKLYTPMITILRCSHVHSLWPSGYATDNKPLVQHVQTLNAARKAAAAANPSFYSTPLKFMSVTDNQFAVMKAPLLALMTNKGAASSVAWTVASAGFKPGETLVDVFTCNVIQADSNGGIDVAGTEGLPQVSTILSCACALTDGAVIVQVLLPASALSKSGKVCPKVATGTQASSGSTIMSLSTAP